MPLSNPSPQTSPSRPAAVLDMGATAIRLVVAEAQPRQPINVLEEAARGVPLGRDVFSTGVIRSDTVEAALSALEGFNKILAGYGVMPIRAVATSAVREARNADMFLDRIRSRTGIAFEIINEAEESRLLYLAVRQRLGSHTALKGEWTLIVEVGGGNTALTLLRRGRPNRSGVYALGAIRMRQQLNLKRQSAELQASLLKRYIANVVEEIRVDIPLGRVTHVIAIGGDARFAASQLQEKETDGARAISRDDFFTFCDQVEPLDDEAVAERFRLPAVEAETLVPALLVYRSLISQTAARRIVVSDASLRAGVLIDMAEPGGRLGAVDFEKQVLASADALGVKYRYDRAHGRHVAALSMRLFDALTTEHGLSGRERLLLQVAALLHDIGAYVNLRGHHKHSLYLLAASQIFGLSDNETAMVANIARYHRRGLPQKSHLAYVALDGPDRLIVNKLASILRVTNALDAEHLQRVRDVKLIRHGEGWILELEGTGDVTMERMVATARADMFLETFGREILIRQAGVIE
jgi:exopolyphosphatase / guanosine-5'-triphosphate,3'-diphosphate pyrophosphatase